MKINFIPPQQLRLKKVEKLINKGFCHINSDLSVAYLLIEIRKIMEADGEKSKYLFLNLFCNWGLHIKIKKSSTSNRVLQKITNAVIRHRGNTFFLPRAVEKNTFSELRKDFGKFLRDHRLTKKLVTSAQEWKCFLDSLIFVLADADLSWNEKVNPKIRILKRAARSLRIKSISLIVIPPNNESMVGRKYGYHHEIAWPWWLIKFSDNTALQIPCFYYSLGYKFAEPNLTGALIGYGWKYGNLV